MWLAKQKYMLNRTEAIELAISKHFLQTVTLLVDFYKKYYLGCLQLSNLSLTSYDTGWKIWETWEKSESDKENSNKWKVLDV